MPVRPAVRRRKEYAPQCPPGREGSRATPSAKCPSQRPSHRCAAYADSLVGQIFVSYVNRKLERMWPPIYSERQRSGNCNVWRLLTIREEPEERELTRARCQPSSQRSQRPRSRLAIPARARTALCRSRVRFAVTTKGSAISPLSTSIPTVEPAPNTRT